MDILAPDEANFEHLKQVDTNIQPYIKNMSRVLTNSIEILISDSFNKAIEIHSHLPHLQFPLSKWIRYHHVSEQQFFKILKNTTFENFPALIENLVFIDKLKNLEHINPFVLSYCFTDDAQSIISKKFDYSEFKNILINKFVEKIPSYKGTVNSFALSEIVKISLSINQEEQNIFKKLTKEQLNTFLSKSFNNDYAFSLFDSQQEILRIFNIPITEYLKSSQNNPIIEHLIQEISILDPFDNSKFPTLYPNEVQLIQSLKPKHDFIVLENQLPEKNVKIKQPKI